MNLFVHYSIIAAMHSFLLFAVVLIIKNWSRQHAAIKWLAVVLLFSFLCDATSIANRWMRLGLPFNITGNFHTMFNPMLMALFFYYLIKEKALRYFLIVFLTANFIFSLTLPMTRQAYASYNTLTESFLILALSILWFFKILRNPPTLDIQKAPEFWIVSGFFLPTSGKLIVYAVSTYLMDVMKDNMVVLQLIHNLLSVFGNILIAFGMYLQHKQLKGNPTIQSYTRQTTAS